MTGAAAGELGPAPGGTAVLLLFSFSPSLPARSSRTRPRPNPGTVEGGSAPPAVERCIQESDDR